MLQNQYHRVIMLRVSVSGQHFIGMSPSGKAPDFDSGIRRFKSCHPSHNDPLAQLAEQLPFKQWVRSSNLRRVTKKADTGWCLLFWFPPRRFEELNAVRMSTAAEGLTEANLNFAFRQNVSESRGGSPPPQVAQAASFWRVYQARRQMQIFPQAKCKRISRRVKTP